MCNGRCVHYAATCGLQVYGPGGSAFVMDCMTDNKQRATDTIWSVVKKCNGKVRAIRADAQCWDPNISNSLCRLCHVGLHISVHYAEKRCKLRRLMYA